MQKLPSFLQMAQSRRAVAPRRARFFVAYDRTSSSGKLIR
jgi:hypothetical protein